MSFRKQLSQPAGVVRSRDQGRQAVTDEVYGRAKVSCQNLKVSKSETFRKIMCLTGLLFFFLHNSPQWAKASSFTRFLDHTQRRTTVGRTPLDEWSAHRRDLHLTIHNTHNRQTSMPPMGFEPTISAGERLYTRPRGHWDHHLTGVGPHNSSSMRSQLTSPHNCRYSWV